MEALVRAAYGRYITTGALHDASDATRKQLLHLRTALPPIARVDPNDFRWGWRRCSHSSSKEESIHVLSPHHHHYICFVVCKY